MKQVFVVGMGPGDAGQMTLACRDAIERSDVIVGYSTYIALIKPMFPEKRTLETGMTREVQRCRAALELADGGETVSVVCSGDAGVYGMAGLILELSEKYPDVAIEILPGVTAALAGAALLGAPLSNDFAVISLSDRLTPWRVIEQRLECAAMGDFCIAVYNPSSKTRAGYLKKACDILLRHKCPETLCGFVRNIARENEETRIMTLGKLRDVQADMFTTVFVGNTQTREIGGRLITTRGYRLG